MHQTILNFLYFIQVKLLQTLEKDEEGEDEEGEDEEGEDEEDDGGEEVHEQVGCIIFLFFGIFIK